jgi:predicted kinase
MPHMTIMRGGPGSGKSTIAKNIKNNPVICSADDFFIRDDGTYDFDPNWLGRAHGACLRKCVEAMVQCRADVVIDNTNSRPAEMIPYLALSQALDYTCEVITVLCDVRIAWDRQIHGVPKDILDDLYANVEQTEVPSLYRKAPWLTITEMRPDGNFPALTPGRPNTIADCGRCTGTIVMWNAVRISLDNRDSCTCDEGEDEPTNIRPCCNCGVSMGLRSDHESQCAAAYAHRRR